MLHSNGHAFHTNGALAGVAVERPRLLKLGQLLDEAQADAEAAHEAFTAGRPRGPITGLASLDRELGGWLQPGLHILHSNSGTVKTALGWQAVTAAKHPALFVSCEMGALELLRRLTARVTNTYLGRLKSGELTPALARQLYERAVASAPHAYLVDATRTFASPDYLLEVAILAKGKNTHFLLVLDSLHAWVEMLPDERASEYEAINDGLASLRLLANQLVCPVLVIAERNRSAMKEGGINAGAGSRRIEFGSESVISLDRKGRPDQTGAVTVEMVLDKNRHGASGKTITVLFDGATQRFTEVTDDRRSSNAQPRRARAARPTPNRTRGRAALFVSVPCLCRSSAARAQEPGCQHRKWAVGVCLEPAQSGHQAAPAHPPLRRRRDVD